MSLAVGGFAGKIGAIVTPLIAQVSFKHHILIQMHEITVSLWEVSEPLLTTPFYTLLNSTNHCRLANHARPNLAGRWAWGCAPS